MTTLSLNEVELSARKAAVGAGLPQGIAYETGRAAAWLAVAGLPALTVCADALEAARDGNTGPGRISDIEGNWLIEPADARPLCPCRAGVAAADLLNAGAHSVTLRAVQWPTLVIALLAALIDPGSATIQLGWENGDNAPPLALAGGVATVASDETLASGLTSTTDLTIKAQATTSQSPGNVYGDTAARQRVVTEGVSPDPAAAERIARLIANTLVPASDLSRDRGAGAGQIDSN